MTNSSQDRPPARGVNRRTALLSAAGALAAGPVIAAATSEADTAETWVAGVVRAVTSPKSLLLEPADPEHGSALPVLLDPAANAHDVVPIASLAPGDEVVAAGWLQPAGLVATRLERMHRVVVANVSDRRGQELATTAGDLRLTPYSSALEGSANGRRLRSRSLDQIRPGDTVAAVVHGDVASGDLVVTAIGVQE